MKSKNWHVKNSLFMMSYALVLTVAFAFGFGGNMDISIVLGGISLVCASFMIIYLTDRIVFLEKMLQEQNPQIDTSKLEDSKHISSSINIEPEFKYHANDK